MFEWNNKDKVMERKGFFGKKEAVPTLNINSTKEFIRFWVALLLFFLFIKVVSGLLSGFTSSWSISAMSFLVGLLLSIVTKNGLHFSIGFVISFIGTYVFDLIRGLL